VFADRFNAQLPVYGFPSNPSKTDAFYINPDFNEMAAVLRWLQLAKVGGYLKTARANLWTSPNGLFNASSLMAGLLMYVAQIVCCIKSTVSFLLRQKTKMTRFEWMAREEPPMVIADLLSRHLVEGIDQKIGSHHSTAISKLAGGKQSTRDWRLQPRRDMTSLGRSGYTGVTWRAKSIHS